jgi:dTDP-4-amino-4,6-dideoxygalactose transaminase
VVRVPDRDQVRARLLGRGVGTGVHYPVPVHLQPAYAGRVALGPSLCQETERAAAEILSLPMYPELTETQIEQVCAALDW